MGSYTINIVPVKQVLCFVEMMLVFAFEMLVPAQQGSKIFCTLVAITKSSSLASTSGSHFFWFLDNPAKIKVM